MILYTFTGQELKDLIAALEYATDPDFVKGEETERWEALLKRLRGGWTIGERMIIIDTWKLRYQDEIQVSIREGDNLLNTKKFYFNNLGPRGKEQLANFLRELRNHFGFKLDI